MFLLFKTSYKYIKGRAEIPRTPESKAQPIHLLGLVRIASAEPSKVVHRLLLLVNTSHASGTSAANFILKTSS